MDNKTVQLLVRRQLSVQLRQIRFDKNYSLGQVATHCDLSAESIDAIERGQNLSVRKYLHLAAYYGKKLHIALTD